MANRLSAFINPYIHKDQVAFTPRRQGSDHIQRAVDIISLPHSQVDGEQAQEGFLLSDDLQKALDSVS